MLATCVPIASAQPASTSPPAPDAIRTDDASRTAGEARERRDEEIEPRAIATSGTTTIGISGFVDRFQSSEQRFPLRLSAQVDVARFITPHIAIAGGLMGVGSAGAASAEADLIGREAPAFHLFAGALYYFTPQSMISVYAGPSYWAQLTKRAASDAGMAAALGGVQALLSSRVGFFVEGGYGLGLQRGSEGEIQTRITTRVGMRVKF